MYRTVTQIDSLTGLLASWFPQEFTRIRLPELSVQGRPVYALRMRAGGGGRRRGVLLVGGVHARELLNPDAIVELAVDLLVSYRLGTAIVYGRRRWPAEDVRIMLETQDIWLLPCSNPDGREHVMNVDSMWRKNRRTDPSTVCVGVDLNRNLDVLWGVTQGQTSCSPCSEVFVGPSAFSEPETRNVKHVLDTYRIDCFADVHSFSELILYPWGHAPTQTSDPSMRFTTLPSGTCTPIARAGYAEYMPPRDLQRFSTVGDRIVEAIKAVRGRVYTAKAGVGLYPTTGTHGDYAYSRHIADPTLRKTYGFTFETGPATGNARESFQPADPTDIKRDAKSGMLALIQQCVCAIELIGLRLLGRDTEVAALRRIRDEMLATTEAGREWIALYDRVQAHLIPVILGDDALSREAAGVLESIGRLIEDDREQIGPAEVERARTVLRACADRSEAPEVRAALDTVMTELARVAGASVSGVIADLMRRGPQGGNEIQGS